MIEWRALMTVAFLAGCGGSQPPSTRQPAAAKQTRAVVSLQALGVAANRPGSATRNRELIQHAIDTFSGTPTVLLLPAGTVFLDRGPHYVSLRFDAATDLELRGRGVERTKLVMTGDATGGYWVGIEVFDGSRRITLTDFDIEQGEIANPSPTQQNHLIQLNAQRADTSDVRLERLHFGPCIGDALRIAGSSPHFVHSVVARDFVMQIGGHPNAPRRGARSGLSLQRGFKNVEISDFMIFGAKNSPIDMEPTAAAEMTGLHIHDGVIDNSGGTTAYAVSLGGWEDPDAHVTPLRDSSLRRVAILEGQLTIINTERFIVENVTVRATANGPMATASEPLLYVYHHNQDLRFSRFDLIRSTGAGNGPLAVISHGTNTFPSNVTFEGGTWISNVRPDAKHRAYVSFESVRGLTMRDVHFVFDGEAPAAHYGLRFRSSARDIRQVRLEGLTLSSPKGSLAANIWFAATNSNAIADVHIVGVSTSSSANDGVLFDATAGSVIDPAPVMRANVFRGARNPWRAINAAAHRVQPREQLGR